MTERTRVGSGGHGPRRGRRLALVITLALATTFRTIFRISPCTQRGYNIEPTARHGRDTRRAGTDPPRGGGDRRSPLPEAVPAYGRDRAGRRDGPVSYTHLTL